MFGVTKYKCTLRNTTALVAVMMFAAPTGARATDYVVDSSNSPFAGPLTLNTGDNLTVINTGSIRSGGSGVLAHSGIAAGSIGNSGTISANNFGIAVFSNSNISGGITNETGGTISGNFAIAVSHSDVSGGITNETGGALSGRTAGIFVFNTGDISGGIINSGTISEIMVATSGNISGGITNESGGNIGGLFVVFSSSNISGGITNETGGTISGTIGIMGSHTDISGGIHNDGLIRANIGIQISSGHMSGGITNASGGTIEGTGGTAISMNGLTGSTPIVINGGHIIGDVIDDTPANGFSPVTIGGDFVTQGNFDVSSVSIAAGKTLEVSTGNTVTTCALTTAGGTLTFGVTSAATYGEIVLTNGGATLTGETITVNVAGGNTLVNGDKILIIDGTTPLVGGPGGTQVTVMDNSAQWNFQIVDGTGLGIGGNSDELYLEATATTRRQSRMTSRLKPCLNRFPAQVTRNWRRSYRMSITRRPRKRPAPSCNPSSRRWTKARLHHR